MPYFILLLCNDALTISDQGHLVDTQQLKNGIISKPQMIRKLYLVTFPIFVTGKC